MMRDGLSMETEDGREQGLGSMEMDLELVCVQRVVFIP